MIEHTRKVYRNTGFTGEFGTDTGSVAFAEEHSGEGFYFEVYNSISGESQQIYLSASDVLTIAQIGLLTECYTADRMLEEIPEIVAKNKERERHLQEMARRRTEMWRPSMPSDLETDYDAAHSWLVDHALPGGDGVPEPYPGDGVPEFYAVEGWGIQPLDNGKFKVYREYK